MAEQSKKAPPFERGFVCMLSQSPLKGSQLCYEFELFGPVMPLWKQPPPLPLGY
jgi:hypothetical protein